MPRTTDPRSTHATDLPRRWFGRFYAKITDALEAEGLAELRQDLLSNLSGTVVEVGAGNGMNFRRYPVTVTHVTAIEPEPYLRSLAERAATATPVPISVRPGTAGRIPLPDTSVDAAVLFLVLCSVTDRPGALAEIRRVLRPGGTLHFFEHTAADTPGLRLAQRVADATVWPLLYGGCHTSTDPVRLITQAGFSIVRTDRVRFPEHRITQPSTPHARGVARKPAE